MSLSFVPTRPAFKDVRPNTLSSLNETLTSLLSISYLLYSERDSNSHAAATGLKPVVYTIPPPEQLQLFSYKASVGKLPTYPVYDLAP